MSILCKMSVILVYLPLHGLRSTSRHFCESEDAMHASLNSGAVLCSCVNIYLYVEGLIFKDLSNTLNMNTVNMLLSNPISIPSASSEEESEKKLMVCASRIRGRIS